MSRMMSGGISSVLRMPRSVTKGAMLSWMDLLVRGAKSMADWSSAISICMGRMQEVRIDCQKNSLVPSAGA